MPSFAIACPFCFRTGNVPPAYFNRRVRCPNCGQTFPVTAQVRTNDQFFAEEDVENGDDSHHGSSLVG